MRPFLFCPRPGCAPHPAHHKLQAQGAHPTEAMKAQACSLRLSEGAPDKRRGIHTPHPHDLQSKGDTQRIASLPHPTSITQRSAVRCQTQRGAMPNAARCNAKRSAVQCQTQRGAMPNAARCGGTQSIPRRRVLSYKETGEKNHTHNFCTLRKKLKTHQAHSPWLRLGYVKGEERCTKRDKTKMQEGGFFSPQAAFLCHTPPSQGMA